MSIKLNHKTNWVSKQYSKPHIKHHEYQTQSQNKLSIKTILETNLYPYRLHYLLTRRCMTPYKEPLASQEAEGYKEFNLRLAMARVKIENAFGDLKNHWGSLQGVHINIRRAQDHISKKKMCVRRIASTSGRPVSARLAPYAWCVWILHLLPSGAHCVATPHTSAKISICVWCAWCVGRLGRPGRKSQFWMEGRAPFSSGW